MFSKVSIVALAAIGLVAASPVLAAGKNQDPSGTATTEQPNGNAKTRYCIRAEMVTGSIRQGRVCKTATEWRAEGVDVTKLQAR
ncbi:hypothetical protein FPZ24_11040 [Sphingomonas panacisoli]|uniref:Uncharacterized protein n=1 Tax=Sphingomonas panacisoli TaxID=1813879 RepID=A0A5B8LIM8_9SPHN|nr:hypothetical protein [Sphingomonas panacisoli]QDZ07951.1 hypothetical protein FPZ24_11040 [Sphingomonas panacisoli]